MTLLTAKNSKYVLSEKTSQAMIFPLRMLSDYNLYSRPKALSNMSGFLFSIIMNWVTRTTVGNGENGIRRRFTPKLDDLDFADDIALISSTKQQIQDKTRKLEEEARRVRLKVSTEKTKTIRINARDQDRIVVNERHIEDVDELTYLGAKVCKEGSGMKDLKNRRSTARGAFIRLKNMWRSNTISRKTKLRLYKTLVVPVLLYGCETRKMNKADDKAIDILHNKCLRKTLRIKWQDHVSTKELLERASMKPLSEEVKYRRWNMIGHILR